MLTKFMILASLILTGCSEDELSTSSDPSSSTTTTTAPVSEQADGSSLRGFVANAFEVTVDGVDYDDLEDFYSQELDRLPEKIKAAGYENPTDIKFEAQIGFKDLFQGMEVFALASGATGYQGNAKVASDGSFELTFPANTATYRIRANKRIRVLIESNSEKSTFCYNFSANEKSAPLDGEPLILRDFSSSLTKYDCPETTDVDSLTIPANPSKNLGKIDPGMTKAEVLAVMGSDGLFVSGTQWCWRPSVSSEKHSNCEIAHYLVCQCSVTFDSNSLLINQSNMNTDRLDILKW